MNPRIDYLKTIPRKETCDIQSYREIAKDAYTDVPEKE